MNDRSLLTPIAYLREIRDYLRLQEPVLWAWCAAERKKSNSGEELRAGLLKSADRLDAADHLELYGYLGNAQRALGLESSATIYQARGTSSQSNAALNYLPTESHIVLSGPIKSMLSPVEWTAVFGHELAHRLLWDAEEGDFLVADQVLEAISRDPHALPAYLETARRFRLNTEIFADRGALQATQDLPKTVAALVKISAGLTLANRESYLEQAAEIFAKGEVKATAASHPEIFLRAHALARWSIGEQNVDTWVQAKIAEEPELATLDVLDQQRVTALTRRLLGQYLRPSWFRTDPILAQARLYFADFAPAEGKDPSLLGELRQCGKLLSEFFVFVLLDFVRVDPQLDQQPVIAALRWAEELGFASCFETLLGKELGLKTRELAKMKLRTAKAIAPTR